MCAINQRDDPGARAAAGREPCPAGEIGLDGADDERTGVLKNVQAQAADAEDKTAGLRCSRVGEYAMKNAAAIGLNFVGGMTEGLQDREVVGQQTRQNLLSRILF